MDQGGFSTYTTFVELGGSSVDLPDLLVDLSQLPLDSVIGFVATLSWQLAKEGHTTVDPRWQAPYLNMAIVDDFPHALRHTSRILVPGRVPFSGDRNVFIHNQNLAILAHLAVLNCQMTEPNYRFTEGLKQRVCRLLLIINDWLNVPIPDTDTPTLIQRRDICLRWLRGYEYGIVTPFMPRAVHNIARQRKIYHLIQENGAYDVEAAFIRSTNGVTLAETYQLLSILLVTVDAKLGRGAVWLPKGLMHSPTEAGARIIESLAQVWIRTPQQYRERSRELTGIEVREDQETALDVRCLRESPLIAGRSDSVTCPCLPFLRDLIQNTPYYIIQDRTDDEREKAKFRSSLGDGFARYVEELISRIANGDVKGRWHIHHRVALANRAHEISDSLLYRDRIAICFEHKAQRPGSGFLSARSGELVLGPSDSTLNKIMAGSELDPVEAKRSDRGMLTHAMWQQSENGDHIRNWVEVEHGATPVQIFPLIVHLYEPRMDWMVRGVYVDKLIIDAQLYSEEYWARPQWLHITDLEALASLADDGKLNLLDLLERKEQDLSLQSLGFDEFLFQAFESVPWDKKLAEYGNERISDAQVFFRESDL